MLTAKHRVENLRWQQSNRRHSNEFVAQPLFSQVGQVGEMVDKLVDPRLPQPRLAGHRHHRGPRPGCRRSATAKRSIKLSCQAVVEGGKGE